MSTQIEVAVAPSREWIANKVEALRCEIDWNINRLGNLILSDSDREQIEDLVRELREEKQSLERCFK